LERNTIDEKTYIVGYHTQEFRPDCEPLSEPVKCLKKNAWIGIGYYFWTELDFAKYWGEDSKMNKSGYYDIYKADLDCENCINAVFDEEGYFFFKEKIEETINHFKTKGLDVTLEQINRFLADNIWEELGVEGIVYDDKPTNPRKSDRIYSEIPNLYYRKRIQIVLFSSQNIHNFKPFLEQQA